MALLSLQDVSIGFGGPRLLEEINLQIETGEWIGLLGRNGMGKSTLINALLPGALAATREISAVLDSGKQSSLQ